MTSTFTKADSFTNPDVQKCPFPLIEKIHEEAPIYIDPVTGFYIISRYEDVAKVSMNPDDFSNKTSLIMSKSHSSVADEIAKRYKERGFERIHTLVTNDPPNHRKYREVVEKTFSPRFVRSLEQYVTDIAEELLDDCSNQNTVNLLEEYCLKIPMFVIADQLGISRNDWRNIKKWSDAIIEAINPEIDPKRELELTDLIIESQNYIYDRGREYQKSPKDTLLSHIANSTINGLPIKPAELVGIGETLMVAGNETTASSIGIAIWKLLSEPELKAQLTENPDLVGAFVEEILRLHAPSPHLYREAKVDTKIGSVDIPAGSILQLSYLAANRDKEKFSCPEKLDLNRPAPKSHMAFGRGIHFCIGNQLARAELRIAIQTILRRCPDMTFSQDHPAPEFLASYHVHTLENLYVSL